MRPSAPAACFIGWDVGGWNCDKNGKSRDAIVILDNVSSIVGKPWRGNLRDCIIAAATTGDWLEALFDKCGVVPLVGKPAVIMAIDAPLGFPSALVGLVTNRATVELSHTSGLNRYLFRHTERHLFERGLSPLSAIKDMIGSQATKGMHALAKFAPYVENCGVWTDGAGFQVIETYPAACRRSVAVADFAVCASLGHDDLDDAYACARVARLFGIDRAALERPTDDVPASEGWIWAPPIPVPLNVHAHP